MVFNFLSKPTDKLHIVLGEKQTNMDKLLAITVSYYFF